MNTEDKDKKVKAIVVKCKDYISDYTTAVIESTTPWEEITEEEFLLLEKYLPYGTRVIKQLTVSKELASIRKLLEELANANKRREEKAKREAERYRNIQKEKELKKRQKALDAAKKLLEEEGLSVGTIPKYDSNGQPT